MLPVGGSAQRDRRRRSAWIWLASFLVLGFGLLALIGHRAARRAARGQTGKVPATRSGKLLWERDQLPERSSNLFTGELRQRLNDAINKAIASGEMPGCVVIAGTQARVELRRAFGFRAVEPHKLPMRDSTVFDLASLTKPIATATSVMVLMDRGKLDLDTPVAAYLPGFDRRGKGVITARHLLTHTSGLPAVNPMSRYSHGRNAALEAIFQMAPAHPAGSQVLYSDLGFIVLGEVVRKVSGSDLGKFSRESVFAPLGMTDTVFVPGVDLRNRVAPTEQQDGRWLQGVVHDPRARSLGGIAGHAGLFSTADDLARLARMLLGQGELDGTRVLKATTVTEFLRPQRTGADRRALGWNKLDVPEGDPVSRWIGHGGFTGTSLWLDPVDGWFVVFLSSRLHPDGRGDIRAVSKRVRSLVADAFGAKKGEVLPGIDVLRSEGFAHLRGQRVGLITNRSGRTRDGKSTVALLQGAPEVDLVALFAPEHGLASQAEGVVHNGIDPDSGLRVYSLYGPSRRPSPAQLEALDTLVFDVQDVGVRFYTYLSTMLESMKAAARAGKRFVVLDRPNPIGGVVVSGPIPDPDRLSWLHFHTIPIRHGMTAGEIAQMLDRELKLGTRLEVVKVRGWRRDLTFGDTGLKWVNPSPNLRSATQALLYPGVALFETSNMSVGRGTKWPFEVLGAPWMDDRLAKHLAKLGVVGIRFRAVEFVPRASTYRGRTCRGVRMVVTNPRSFRPIRAALVIASQILETYPERWDVARFDDLLASRATWRAVQNGDSVQAIEALWTKDLLAFRKRREAYLLY